MTVRNEIMRKTLHLCFLVIPLGMAVFSRSSMLVFTGILLVTALIVEWLRKNHSGIGKVFIKFTKSMLREHEYSKITGATYLIFSAFFSILFYQSWIAQIVLLFVIISDGFSALVGKCWGKHRFGKGKTWEGNVVFLVTAVLIIIIHPECAFYVGIAGVFAAFFADVYITGIDDNVTIPIFAGFVMEIMSRLLM